MHSTLKQQPPINGVKQVEDLQLIMGVNLKVSTEVKTHVIENKNIKLIILL